MPVDQAILGFSNEWYGAAVDQTQRHELRSGLTISIPRPPVFLATKLAAFKGRGDDDLLGSHDLEDIITLVAGRPEIVEEVRGAVDAVRIWIAGEISALLEQPDFDYALQGALPDAVRIPEFGREVLDRFQAIGAMG
jgi:predicted nucleotidyltransferase